MCLLSGAANSKEEMYTLHMVLGRALGRPFSGAAEPRALAAWRILSDLKRLVLIPWKNQRLVFIPWKNQRMFVLGICSHGLSHGGNAKFELAERSKQPQSFGYDVKNSCIKYSGNSTQIIYGKGDMSFSGDGIRVNADSFMTCYGHFRITRVDIFGLYGTGGEMKNFTKYSTFWPTCKETFLDPPPYALIGFGTLV